MPTPSNDFSLILLRFSFSFYTIININILIFVLHYFNHRRQHICSPNSVTTTIPCAITKKAQLEDTQPRKHKFYSQCNHDLFMYFLLSHVNTSKQTKADHSQLLAKKIYYISFCSVVYFLHCSECQKVVWTVHLVVKFFRNADSQVIIHT